MAYKRVWYAKIISQARSLRISNSQIGRCPREELRETTISVLERLQDQIERSVATAGKMHGRLRSVGSGLVLPCQLPITP